MALVLLMLSGLLACSTARGATLRVPADFGTIQAALDAAAGGDSVLVAAGTESPAALV